MSEFKGSKGVWCYRPELGEIVCEGRGVIADMYCNGDEKANGSVMASAPDLLAALQLANHVITHLLPEKSASRKRVVEISEAAIAKALGQ